MEFVVLKTSLGDIQLELYWNHAPRVSLFVLESRGRIEPMVDVQELRRTCEVWILQRSSFSPNYL